jgi:hypothetical protein
MNKLVMFLVIWGQLIVLSAQKNLTIYGTPPRAFGRPMSHNSLVRVCDTIIKYPRQILIGKIDSIMIKKEAIQIEKSIPLTARIVYCRKILFIRIPVLIAYRENTIRYHGKYYLIDKEIQSILLEPFKFSKKYFWIP